MLKTKAPFLLMACGQASGQALFVYKSARNNFIRWISYCGGKLIPQFLVGQCLQ